MSHPLHALNLPLEHAQDGAESPELFEAITPVLTVVKVHATTTSLDIARHFDKRHDHVLRSIRDLLTQLPAECAPNFGETSIDVPGPNGGARSEPAFLITRDGFTLLAMGFKGKRALAFKLAYLDAFNAMEKQLQAGAASGAMIGRVTGLPTKQLCSLQDQWWKLVQRLERTTQADARAGLYQQLLGVCADMGHPAPPLQSLGHETPPQPEAVTEFWAAFDALENAGVKVNHSHNPGLIAVNLKQFIQLAVAHGLPLAKSPVLKEALRLSQTPKFMDQRTVRSAIVGSAIYCWLFEADTATRAAA
jgi:Rha family phage regulatory protein